jgi:hypothetical protein
MCGEEERRGKREKREEGEEGREEGEEGREEGGYKNLHNDIFLSGRFLFGKDVGVHVGIVRHALGDVLDRSSWCIKGLGVWNPLKSKVNINKQIKVTKIK